MSAHRHSKRPAIAKLIKKLPNKEFFRELSEGFDIKRALDDANRILIKIRRMARNEIK